MLRIYLKQDTFFLRLKLREKMKRFLPLFCLATAEEVPGLNGWHVTCRVPIPKPGFTLI